MIWQDAVIAASGVVFALALVPAVRKREAPPLLTSAPTAAMLFAVAFAFGTLDLAWSALTTFCSACLWARLAGIRFADRRLGREYAAREAERAQQECSHGYRWMDCPDCRADPAPFG